MNRTIRSLSAHALTVLVTLGLVSLWMGSRTPVNQLRGPRFFNAGPPAPTPPTPDLPSTPIPEEVLKQADADEQINIRVYSALNKAVVNITTEVETRGFFGDEVSAGSGSGFVIDKKGHILTNFHVVEGADTVRVTLFNGSTHDAKVVGLDASNDVAVIQVDSPADLLHPVSFGDSSKVLVGQKILAIGNPFGLERTLTTGIISSLDRSLKAKNGRTIKGIIQTDAAINPGNSGGPLLNTRGQVIGMNTAIVSQVGQSAGISFAVPINSIVRILRPLIENGRVIRADIGLTRVYRTNGGLLVLGTVEGGPADQAGIKPIGFKIIRFGNRIGRQLDPESADIIKAIDGKPVRSVEDLLNEVESHAPGETVDVTIVRDGREIDLQVTLGRS